MHTSVFDALRGKAEQVRERVREELPLEVRESVASFGSGGCDCVRGHELTGATILET